MSPARLAPRLLLAAAATALALAAGEGLLALADLGGQQLVSPLRIVGARIGATITVPDDDLLVRLRPDSTFLGYYHTNSRGWRGPEVAQRPAPGATRIVCVGDSCTFGFGLDEADAWPRQLERLLTLAYAEVATFDVVNTGVPGYSTWQNRLQVEREVVGLSPALVVVLPSGHNDITGARRFSDAEQSAYNRSLRRRFEQTRWYRSLDQRLAGASPEEAMATPAPGVPDTTWRVSPAETGENLAAIAASVTSSGSALLMLVPGHRLDALETVPAYGAYAELVAARAAQLDVPALDLRPALAAWSPAAPFLDPVHPDERGSAEIAWAVFEWLVRHDGLAPPGERTEWLRAWLDARAGRRRDLDWLASGAGPALVEQARLRLRQAGPSAQAFAREPSPFSDAVRRYDPLHGSQRWQHLPGLLELLARLSAAVGDVATSEQLQLRAAAIQEHRLPRTPQGVAALELPAEADVLADVRALLVFEALLRGPARPVDERLELARQAHEAMHGEAALALLDPLIALVPDDPAALLLRGEVLRRLGRFAEADQAFARAVQLDPDAPEAQTQLARADYKAGRLEAAEQRLTAVVARHPNHALARYLLGRLYKDTDRPQQAWSELGAARAFSFLGQFPDLGQLVAELLAAHPELGEGASAR